MVAARFDVTFGAVSQHLRVLEDAGLVSVRRDGRRRLAVPAGSPTVEITLEPQTGGTRLELRGAPESCQGVVRFRWAAIGPGRGRSWPPGPTSPGPTWTGGSAG